MSESLLKDALNYFGSDPGFRCLFSLFKRKYESYGRIGGSVKISSLTNQEIEPIARFYGIEPQKMKEKRAITLLSFERKLQETKFEGIGLLELLQAYFNEPLVSKKEAKEQQQFQQQTILTQLQMKFSNLGFWYEYLQNRSADTYWIFRLLDESHFESYNDVLSTALANQPNTYERLPVFSQRITGNPHAFDLSTELGKLWLHVLFVLRGKKQDSAPPTDTERINDLLLEFNLLRDDITNYVTCANLTAETEESEHPMWKAAADSSSVMNVPLRELLLIKNAYPNNKKGMVWIVENSGVFSSLLDAVPDVPLICTHGQFKLAALKLLDMLVSSDCQLYYSGDFDPEGLAMAARLSKRYSQAVTYWRMDLKAYKRSNPSVKLGEERLAKLNNIADPQLTEVIEEMQKNQNAGYQEALLEMMIGDLREER